MRGRCDGRSHMVTWGAKGKVRDHIHHISFFSADKIGQTDNYGRTICTEVGITTHWQWLFGLSLINYYIILRDLRQPQYRLWGEGRWDMWPTGAWLSPHVPCRVAQVFLPTFIRYSPNPVGCTSTGVSLPRIWLWLWGNIKPYVLAMSALTCFQVCIRFDTSVYELLHTELPWGGKASQRFTTELCPSARNRSRSIGADRK